MSRILRLAKVLRKSGSGSSEKDGSSLDLDILALVLAIVASLGLAYLGYVFGGLNLYGFTAWDIQKLLFGAGTLMAIFFTLPGIVNHMYMSSDLGILMTFPFSMKEIVFAKLRNVTGNLWLIFFSVSFPFGVVYGVTSGAGVLHYIALILGFICEPLFIISVVGSLTIIVMSYVKVIRSKDVMRILGAIVAFVIIVGLVVVLNMGTNDKSALANSLGGAVSASDIMILSVWLELFAEQASILHLLLVVLVTAVCCAIFLLLLNKLYVSSALALQETAGGSGSMDEKSRQKLSTRGSVLKAYTTADMLHVKREPAYLMQGFLYTIIYPAVFLFIMFISPTAGSFFSIDAFPTAGGQTLWCVAVSMLVTFFAASTNSIACSPMSREGSGIMILKQTPVDYAVVIRAKRSVALLICSMGSIAYTVIGGIVLLVMGKAPFYSVLLALVSTNGWLVWCVNTNMLHDIKKPNFVWDSEAVMLKKCSGAVSVIMLIVMGVVVPLGLLIVSPLLAGYEFIISAAVAVVGIVLAIISGRNLFVKGKELMLKY